MKLKKKHRIIFNVCFNSTIVLGMSKIFPSLGYELFIFDKLGYTFHAPQLSSNLHDICIPVNVGLQIYSLSAD